ncbi:MAG: hypothetical protein MUF61_00895, partial [archaeon]|nr:hypothetical protein [archaeon]
CKHYDFVKPLQDETVVYCGKFEDVNEVLRIYHNTDKSESPRIAQYREKGCDKIARCLRKLDEVLKDAG